MPARPVVLYGSVQARGSARRTMSVCLGKTGNEGWRGRMWPLPCEGDTSNLREPSGSWRAGRLKVGSRRTCVQLCCEVGECSVVVGRTEIPRTPEWVAV